MKTWRNGYIVSKNETLPDSYGRFRLTSAKAFLDNPRDETVEGFVGLVEQEVCEVETIDELITFAHSHPEEVLEYFNRGYALKQIGDFRRYVWRNTVMRRSDSDYVLQLAHKSVCPNCDKHLELLCSDSYKRKPWFYICFDCRRVFEVAKGEVPRE